MKKFMKAIAFVTVMCMALSTVAFAATEGAVLNGEKVLDITVTGAGADQVALMVVASTANDFSAPLYIDQKASAGDSVDFTAVLTNADVDAVDIYVGYSSWVAAGNNTARKIGEDVEIKEDVTEITIAKTSAELVSSEGAAGVGATFTVTAPVGAKATSMIWAIRYNKTVEGVTTEDIKYTAKQNLSEYGLGDVINNSSVKLGVAFPNGSDEIEALDITGVDAIFFFQDVETPVVTHEDLWNDDNK